jgi:hypothetical protein
MLQLASKLSKGCVSRAALFAASGSNAFLEARVSRSWRITFWLAAASELISLPIHHVYQNLLTCF